MKANQINRINIGRIASAPFAKTWNRLKEEENTEPENQMDINLIANVPSVETCDAVRLADANLPSSPLTTSCSATSCYFMSSCYFMTSCYFTASSPLTTSCSS